MPLQLSFLTYCWWCKKLLGLATKIANIFSKVFKQKMHKKCIIREPLSKKKILYKVLSLLYSHTYSINTCKKMTSTYSYGSRREKKNSWSKMWDVKRHTVLCDVNFLSNIFFDWCTFVCLPGDDDAFNLIWHLSIF